MTDSNRLPIIHMNERGVFVDGKLLSNSNRMPTEWADEFDAMEEAQRKLADEGKDLGAPKIRLERLHATGALQPRPMAHRGLIRGFIVALGLLAAFVGYLIATPP